MQSFDCRDRVLQLLKIIDKVNFNEAGTLEKMKQEMIRYQKFNNVILKCTNETKIKTPKIDVKEYAKYLLQEGTRDEKREILNCLKKCDIPCHHATCL